MSTTGQRGQVPARRRGPRRAARLLLRSALLGATVFTGAALTGVLLSGAAPADLISDPTPAESAAAGPATSSAPEVALDNGAIDATFARSMIYSGVTALAVSVTGSAMVLRRRRHW
jgi:hypothetical protein